MRRLVVACVAFVGVACSEAPSADLVRPVAHATVAETVHPDVVEGLRQENQYLPGSANWPPPEVLGPQWMPGDPLPKVMGEAQWMPGDPSPEPLGPQWMPSTSPTTVAPSTEVPAISVTASTVAQDPAVIAAVTAAVGATEAAYEAALRNPADATLRDAIVAATVPESPAQQEFVGTYDAIVAAGQWSAPAQQIPNSVTIVLDPFVGVDGAEAFVMICHVSGDLLMGRDDEGNEEVLDGSRNARLIIELFQLVEGTWRLSERTVLETFPEGASCDPETPPSSPVPSS